MAHITAVYPSNNTATNQSVCDFKLLIFIIMLARINLHTSNLIDYSYVATLKMIHHSIGANLKSFTLPQTTPC